MCVQNDGVSTTFLVTERQAFTGEESDGLLSWPLEVEGCLSSCLCLRLDV